MFNQNFKYFKIILTAVTRRQKSEILTNNQS